MSINATEAVGGGFFGPPEAAASTEKAGKDKQLFLELLVAQLRYQDPLKPTDNSEFLSQTAQFNTLEQMTELAQQSAMMVSTQMAFGAAGLVGKTVSWTDTEGAPRSGVVTGATFAADGPILEVDGQQVPMVSVTTVGAPVTTTDSPSDSPTDSTDTTDSSPDAGTEPVDA